MEVYEHVEDSDAEEDVAGTLHQPRILVVDDYDHQLQDEDDGAGDKEGVTICIVQDRLVPR